ncbi:hypothetical protein M0812_03134 [Anaeramoeba flamelloides]|uniref:Uncharacterized protein n=1 Tax=Anaeramoeba flamelloides TaxID=1746091 RepID=A0AAV7YRW6_9EUKA|nr:hypothetical protein M0812_03134 [Anaeramoeba flamelloides]
MSTRTPVGIFTEKISELQELYLSKNDKLDRALLVNERLETSIKSLTHALEETRSQLKKMGQQNKILESENKNLRYQLKNSQIHNSDLQQFQNAVLEVVNKKSKHSSNHNEKTKNAFGSSRSPKSKHPIRHSSHQDTKGKQSNYKRNKALNTTRVSNTTTESEQERFERFEEMQKKQQNRSAMEEMNQDLLKIQKDFENVFQEKNHQPTKKEKTPFNPKSGFYDRTPKAFTSYRNVYTEPNPRQRIKRSSYTSNSTASNFRHKDLLSRIQTSIKKSSKN